VTVRHPAKFNDRILERIVEMFDEFGWPKRIIDPFAGTGKVHLLTEGRPTESIGIELEPEWANLHPNTQVGNALHLPFEDASFDCLCTSPSYGNRLADSHEAKDGSRRYSYRHVLGRKLHPDNSGQLQWGQKYRDFHQAAWREALRVLTPDALIAINSSNHIRGGKEQLVTEWHLAYFLEHGCAVLDLDTVITSRLRHGANRESRSGYENVFLLKFVAPVLTPYEPSDEEEIYDGDDVPVGRELAHDVDAGAGGQRP
jgi:SAM-dependent methyltransferase